MSGARGWSARLLLAVAALVGLGGVLAGPAGPATAAPASSQSITDCLAAGGTVIAVDFAHWGGPVVRGCDPKPPTNGAKLLTDQGFVLSGDQHDGPAFICRIGNEAWDSGTSYPTPHQDACIVTPPASAYWSYWLAPAGQDSWSYSQLGAYSEQPKAGEVELWIFGGTNVAGTEGGPTCTPATLRSNTTSGHCSPVGPKGHGGSSSAPPKTSPRTGAPAGGGVVVAPAGGGAAATSAASGPGSSSARSSSTGSRAPSLTPSEAAALASAKALAATQARAAASAAGSAVASSNAPTVAPTVGEIVAARPGARLKTSSGSAVPLIIGIGIAAVLAGGGGFAVWRRRQLSQ